MLFSLARGGHAPAAFGRLSRRGTPLNALAACTAGLVLAVVAAKVIPQNAFVVLVGIAIFGGLYAWAQIFLTHLFFLRKTHGGTDAQTHGGGDPVSVPGLSVRPSVRASVRPGLTWRYIASALGLAFMVAILVTTWWVPGFRVTLLCGIPWLAFLTVTWRVSRSNS